MFVDARIHWRIPVGEHDLKIGQQLHIEVESDVILIRSFLKCVEML